MEPNFSALFCGTVDGVDGSVKEVVVAGYIVGNGNDFDEVDIYDVKGGQWRSSGN